MTEAMGEPLSVLLVEDSEDDAFLLMRELRRAGYDVTFERVETWEAMQEALDRQGWNVVIADYRLPRFSGPDALALMQQRGIDLPFIIVSGTINEDVAVASLKVGAHDFVTKGNLTRLAPAIDRGLREVEERRVRRQAEKALRESEERYRELVENANDVVFTVDLQGNFTSLNAAGEAISGYTRIELVRMNMAQVLPPESLQRAFLMIQQKLVDNRPTIYELELIAKDGHRVPLEVSTRLIFHDGAPNGVQGIARDITERKRAAQALRESEERYRGLFENASDIVYTHDFDGVFTSMNRAAEAATGYSPDELLGRSIATVVAPDHLDLAREMTHRKLGSGAPTTYELDVITKDGRRVTLEINSQLIYHGGDPTGVQGIARDVTVRRRAEEELRSRERKQAAVAGLGQRALASTNLPALFDDAVDCVAQTLDVEYCTITELLADGKALLARAGIGWKSGLVGTATVGAGPESQAGYTLHSSEPVVVEDLATETRFSVPAVLTDHHVTSGMSVIIHGTARPFGVLSAFTVDRRTFTRDDVHFLQTVANVLSTAIERGRLEEERARHSKELATRVIQAQEEERKRIARELHDETAQSLSMLLTHLDLLEPNIPPEDVVLKTGFERVEALARRTLDETRAMSHDLRPTILDDVGLVAALQWVAAEYEQTFGGSARVDAEPQIDNLSPEVEVALFRIAQEAVNNSGKHARARSVSVSLSFPDTMVRLVIEDDGRGFDPKRVKGPTRQGRLGLYGMNERAELLGGSLSITRRRKGGTRIMVEIPRLDTVRAELTLDALRPVEVSV